jgi:hypothetical protein
MDRQQALQNRGDGESEPEHRPAEDIVSLIYELKRKHGDRKCEPLLLDPDVAQDPGEAEPDARQREEIGAPKRNGHNPCRPRDARPAAIQPLHGR